MSLESSIHIGLEMQRPDAYAALAGLYFYASDTQELSLCNGTQWSVVPLTVVFGPSGANHSLGMVPDAGSSAGITRYLREDATWQSPPGTGSGIALAMDLEFVSAIDVTQALTLDTWTTVIAPQNFTVVADTRQICVSVGGTINIFSNPGGAGAAILIDGSDRRLISGCYVPANGTNVLAGSQPKWIGTLSEGVHTVAVQIYMDASGNTAYCRSNTRPNIERCTITVLEIG